MLLGLALLKNTSHSPMHYCSRSAHDWKLEPVSYEFEPSLWYQNADIEN